MSVRNTGNKKNTQNIIIISLMSALFIFIIIGGILIYFQNQNDNENTFDETINSQNYDYENTVYYEISSEIEINTEDHNGKFEIYLGTDNICMVKVEIFDGEENKIAESSYIYPNENKQKIEFEVLNISNQQNSDGNALITAYNMKTFEPVGSKKENIKLNFKN